MEASNESPLRGRGAQSAAVSTRFGLATREADGDWRDHMEALDGPPRAGRIPDDGFLLLSSVPYESLGVERARAELKARFLARFAADELARAYPRLAQRMHHCTAVLDWSARRLEVIEPVSRLPYVVSPSAPR